MMQVDWKSFTLLKIEEFCNDKISHTFMLKEFTDYYIDVFASAFPDNNTVKDKIRQIMQQLRDDNLLRFDERGSYTYLGLLQSEQSNQTDQFSNLSFMGNEYLLENLNSDSELGYAKLAKNHFGTHCMFEKCQNTFLTAKSLPYIEVHHILPLADGGEDILANLSVVCAHHHRMAHYAKNDIKQEIRTYLLSENKRRLGL